MTSHVVALKSDDPNGPLRNLRTGILLTDTGIVLTILEPSAGSLLSTDISKLKVKVFSEALEADAAVTGVIFGNDWRRNLVVIKLAQSDLAKLKVQPLALVGFTGGGTTDVCVVGFKETEQGKFHAVSTDEIARTAGSDILWHLGFRADLPEMGGAVIDPADGSLLGIIVGSAGDSTDFLPIEFADTLLSQVFIARIMRDMDSLMATKDLVQSGVGWNYQILNSAGSAENPADFQIRFFLQRYSTDLPISNVEVSTLLWGTDSDGNTDISVQTSRDDRPDTLPLENQNFVEYSASKYIDRAKNLGFRSIDRIRVSLIPKFKRPAGHPGNDEKKKTVFEFQIFVNLEAGQSP